MANRLKLSRDSISRVQEKIRALGGDRELSKMATKRILSPYKSQIEQRNGLSIADIQKYLIETQKLDERSLSRILASEIYRDCQEQNRGLSYTELQQLIDEGCIVGRGISKATCQKFRQGYQIDNKAFKLLCETLDENWEQVRHQEINLNQEKITKEQRFNIALSRFNYRSERMKFRNYSQTINYHSLYLKKSTINQYSCHWLLKSLILDPNNHFEHRIIPLNPLVISSRVKDRVGHRLCLQFREYLKQNKSSQFNHRLTKESTIVDIARELQNILQKQNIIFLIQSLDEIGAETGKAILREFWQPIVENLAHTKYRLFICFVSLSQIPEWQFIELYSEVNRLTPVRFEVGSLFDKEDLTYWLKEPLHNQFCSQITTIQDIPVEVERIWNNCQGDNDRLLREIHLSCNCQLQEDLWYKI